jgi:hypothetical protein
MLFVCDKGQRKILQFNVRIMVNGLAVSAPFTLVQNVDCAGMHLDKFGNFFYADTTRNLILKISE